MVYTLPNCNVIKTHLMICIIWTSLARCDGVEVSNLVLEVQHDVWEGEGAWMRCTWHPATADVSQLSWYKNEVDDQHLVYYYSTRTSHSKYVHAYNDLENRAVGKQIGNVHEIYINKTVLEDEGSYFCQYSAVTGNKMLTVGVRPIDLSVTGLDQWVKVNTQVDVTCKVGKVKPKADIYWRKGDTMTPTATSAVVTELADDTFQLVSSFKVSFTKSDHHRQFHCIVTRPGYSSVIWANISKTVGVYYVPKSEVSCSENPTQGNTVTLTCDIIDGRPRTITKVTWEKGDDTMLSTGITLSIPSADHASDDGQYSCAAENIAGRGDFSAVFNLEINYKPVVSVVRPRAVVEGQSVTMVCQSQGARPAVDKVTWKKDQKVIRSDRAASDFRYAGGNVQTPSLTIKLATRNDVGRYTCQLGNDVGQGSSTVELNVWYRPYGKATMESENIAVTAGGHVTLVCKEPAVAGDPAASWFYWRKQNTDFSSNTTSFLVVTASNVNESGKYSCVAGNWVGQSDDSDWIAVTVQVPPETPKQFVILSNSTSLALTLQWQPGLSGSHPPQVFVIQYGAFANSNAFHGLSIASTNSKQQQLTVVGLEPETLYKFTLFAHNNNTDVIRSVVTTASGWTAAIPKVEIETVDIQADHMTITWSDQIKTKGSMSAVVSVVILYQRNGGEVYRFPAEGSVEVTQQPAFIYETFDLEATYKVWLKVYEGQLTFPSRTEQRVEITATKGNGCSCNTVTITAAVFGSVLVICIVGLVFGIIRKTRQRPRCNDGADQFREERKREVPMEMTDDIRSSTEVVDDSKHYQHLSDRVTGNTSALRGTYASLDEREGATQPVPAAAYEDSDAIRQQPPTYVNTSVTGGETAEYAEVT